MAIPSWRFRKESLVLDNSGVYRQKWLMIGESDAGSTPPQPVFRFRPDQPVVWWHRSLEKSNQECLYCGRLVGDESLASDKEHLIAREFGPEGSFVTGKEFNFIFRACKECNGHKSNLERHLSSVTLFNSPARSDAAVDASARRKGAKDTHPVEKKLVQDSHSSLSIAAKGSGMSMKFGLVAPPQPAANYVKNLAFCQIQALFSLTTTADPTIRGTTRILPEHHFQFFGYTHINDWGNPQLMEIQKRALDVPVRAIVVSANGFFKVIMRRDQAEKGEWFWALEWNKWLGTPIWYGISEQLLGMHGKEPTLNSRSWP
ncbi:MAG: hypothetical protein KF691_04105 [Phycisphaeraceae bacterium]|nr:hypothetical protein [Phycisphaeraceae bacterium]